MSIEYERPEWHKDAACIGKDVNLFFPKRGETHRANEAKRICMKCPVREECLAYSLELAQEFDTVGIFGGLTGQGRKQMMKEMGIKMSYAHTSIAP